MKTTIDIPDRLFRKVKSLAAKKGISLKEFFTQAATAEVRRTATRKPPWRKAFGGLSDLHLETKRIERVIAREFDRIDG